MVRFAGILSFLPATTLSFEPLEINWGLFKKHSPPVTGLIIISPAVNETGGIALLNQLVEISQLPFPIKVYCGPV